MFGVKLPLRVYSIFEKESKLLHPDGSTLGFPTLSSHFHSLSVVVWPDAGCVRKLAVRAGKAEEAREGMGNWVSCLIF